MFWLGSYVVGAPPSWRMAATFVLLHLFLYPASNAYNSYFDRDTTPIGGLAKPPEVPQQELWYLIIAFDLAGLFLATTLGHWVTLGVLGYVLASKAYSWPVIRLKAHPYGSLVVVAFFQGAWTFWTVLAGLGASYQDLFTPENKLWGAIAAGFLLGSYPLTQIYQHREDSERGDRTFSLVLGVRNTFLWSATIMGAAGASLGYIWISQGEWLSLGIFSIGMAPVTWVLFQWANKAWQDESVVTHQKAMQMNMVSSLCFSGVFIVLWVLKWLA